MERPIVITGATGNLGSAIVRKLCSDQPERPVTALVRESSDTAELDTLGVKVHRCDLKVPATYIDAIPSGAVFVAVAHRSLTVEMLPHLEGADVSHLVAITSTTVFITHHSRVAEYRAIEDKLQASTLPLTILRPSMIYGHGRDKNISRLLSVMARFPVYPVFGSGDALMQPVHVDDLSDGVVAAIQNGTLGEFILAGPEPLTYNQLLRTTAEALGRTVWILHVPHRLAVMGVRVLQKLPRFPVSVEQVMRLTEDKAYDITPAREALGYSPRPYSVGIRQEVEELRKRGDND